MKDTGVQIVKIVIPYVNEISDRCECIPIIHVHRCSRLNSLSQLVTINYYRLLKVIITYHLIHSEKTQLSDKGK